ncbi:MAG: YceI family protein [Acidimicrobiales bacterium]
MNKAKIAIGIVVALIVLAFGGTWLYINVIKDDAPEKLTLDSGPTTTAASGGSATTTTAGGAATADGVDGTWKASSDSVVGYRVKEVLFGQSTEGVGRTNAVTGSMTIAGTTVSDATFSVDLTTMKSDSNQRDGQFQNRIMNTSQFPKATFELTKPIDLGSIPADGTEITAKATGDLTLRGKKRSVQLDITAKRTGSTISTLSTYDVVFADWGIDNPSFGPAQTEDHGLLEIKLVFSKS